MNTPVPYHVLQVLAGYDDGRDPRQLPHITIPEYTKEVSF